MARPPSCSLFQKGFNCLGAHCFDLHPYCILQGCSSQVLGGWPFTLKGLRLRIRSSYGHRAVFVHWKSTTSWCRHAQFGNDSTLQSDLRHKCRGWNHGGCRSPRLYRHLSHQIVDEPPTCLEHCFAEAKQNRSKEITGTMTKKSCSRIHLIISYYI